LAQTEPPMPTMSDIFGIRDRAERVGRYWWLLLVTGVAWIVVSVIVFRFDYDSVVAVAILFGILALMFGAVEFALAMVSRGWWRVLHALLAVIFVIVGVVAFFSPGNTFVALAAVISFYFILKGTFDLIVALATRPENDVWWLGLIVGVAEILLGFWAAGNFGNKVILLVVWVGVAALTRGISEILFAFTLRHMRGAV
jgi:uncharacterized membrane protein HdeD (DUF308 family)